VFAHSYFFFFFSSRRRHTRFDCDWSSDVCSSDLSRSWSGRRTASRPSTPRPCSTTAAFTSRTTWPGCGAWTARPAASSGSTNTADRKSTRLNSSHSQISYAVFCLKKKKAQLDDDIVSIIAVKSLTKSWLTIEVLTLQATNVATELTVYLSPLRTPHIVHVVHPQHL